MYQRLPRPVFTWSCATYVCAFASLVCLFAINPRFYYLPKPNTALTADPSSESTTINNIAATAESTSTSAVDAIVSRLVGHVTLCISCRTSRKNFAGLVIVLYLIIFSYQKKCTPFLGARWGRISA
jgi:hypothetical protein